MVHYKNYVAGWLDSSIHDFLAVLPTPSASAKYALITCLDSNVDPRSLLGKSPELKGVASDAKPLGKGLILPTRLLLEADAARQIFFGFDELWFFPNDQIQPKPEAVRLVGPARIDGKQLGKLGRWMSANSCSLALGDGEGLNLIVKARGLVKYLLAHSIEQSQPTLTTLETADSA